MVNALITEGFKDKLLDLSGNGIYVYDLQRGANLYINQQYTNLTGYSLDDINSMGEEEFFDLFHPDDQMLISEHMDEVINSKDGEIIEAVYRFKKADGTWMWCLSRDTVFDKNVENIATQFMGSFIDITKQKETEFRLREINRKLIQFSKEQEQFVYIASHDLQEPIRTVLNFSKLMMKECGGCLANNSTTYLKYISEASERMSSLVKDLLDYSRIGRDKEMVMVDCNKIVHAVCNDLKQAIDETNTVIEIADLPIIKGYETELRILFQNLITNSIKFRNKDVDPKIIIKSTLERGYYQFTIQDNGIGIDPKFHERIFGMFQRLHVRSKFEGTGIGLAHCKKIVELHRGDIWVKSKVGEGSKFFLTIPY